MKDPRAYIDDIQECITRIQRYTRDGLAELSTDEKAQDAVLRNFQVLAEAAARIPERYQQLFTSVDWQGIREFRNLIVHEYRTVDWDIIWDVVKHDLPVLRQAVDEMLAAMDEELD